MREMARVLMGTTGGGICRSASARRARRSSVSRVEVGSCNAWLARWPNAPDRVRREVLVLVGLVLLVDGLFIAGYFAAGMVRGSDTAKVVYTGLWTVVTMVVVLRGLTADPGVRARLRVSRAGPSTRDGP